MHCILCFIEINNLWHWFVQHYKITSQELGISSLEDAIVCRIAARWHFVKEEIFLYFSQNIVSSVNLTLYLLILCILLTSEFRPNMSFFNIEFTKRNTKSRVLITCPLPNTVKRLYMTEQTENLAQFEQAGPVLLCKA